MLTWLDRICERQLCALGLHNWVRLFSSVSYLKGKSIVQCTACRKRTRMLVTG